MATGPQAHTAITLQTVLTLDALCNEPMVLPLNGNEAGYKDLG